MLANYTFKGKIDGKSIKDYQNKIDLSVKTSQEIIDQVNEILNIEEINGVQFNGDLFWQVIWDEGVCKTDINTSELCWSNTEVCKTLEILASYILMKDDKEKRKECKMYDDYKLTKRAEKDREKVCQIGVNEDDEVVVLKDVKNYKKYKKTTVNKSDIKEYSELKCYDDYKEYMKTLFHGENAKENRLELIEKLKNKGYDISNGKLYKFVKTTLPSISEDMLSVKLSKTQPIKWKQPLRDSHQSFNFEMLDMFDPQQVKYALVTDKNLEFSTRNEFCITLDEIIKKTHLTKNQKIILSKWRKDWQVVKIAEYMQVDVAYVSREIDTIAKKISNAYIDEYEEQYYYMNLVKGTYKKCSCCGENKLVKHFNKHSVKNGEIVYMSICSDCRKKHREKKKGRGKDEKERFNKKSSR